MAASLREYGNLLAARLRALTPATLGYYGGIGRRLPGDTTSPADPPAKSSLDPTVVPYFILYPGAGDDGPDQALCETTPEGTTITVRITAAAGDVEDLLALIDRINRSLLGWRPAMASSAFPGALTRLPGYSAAILNDTSQAPPRPYALLQYQATI